MALIIKTDGKWKQFRDRDEVPKKVLRDQFDWTNEAHEEHGDYSDGFFRYHHYWYHVSEFLRSDYFENWDGYAGDSYFSGTLIKLSDDGEQYQVGSYRS